MIIDLPALSWPETTRRGDANGDDILMMEDCRLDLSLRMKVKV